MRVHRWWQFAAAMATALILGGLSVGTGTAAAQGIGGLLSGSATTGVPDWVRPGTRLTFYTAGASIANADYQWQQDENGTWEDPATGTRYSQTDVVDAQSGELILTAYSVRPTRSLFAFPDAGGGRHPWFLNSCPPERDEAIAERSRSLINDILKLKFVESPKSKP